jgi:hypothetical protein
MAQMDNIVPYQHQKHAMMDEGVFSNDPLCSAQGFIVLLDAVQLAFYMGYDRVYIGGVDLHEHMNLPIARIQEALRVAQQHFERHGRILAKITDSSTLPLKFVKDDTLPCYAHPSR